MTDVMPRKPEPEAPAGGQPTLVTPRLRLRPLRAADAAQIALHAGDRKVAWMTTRIPHPYPPGAAEAVVERARGAARRTRRSGRSTAAATARTG
jgi:RimJ/RimL family protein N-acetyltransferase